MIVRLKKNGVTEAEGKPVFSHYPDGQPHLKLELFKDVVEYDTIEVHCSLRNPAELFNLQMLADVISVNNPPQEPPRPVHLYVYWLFGARMDRRIDNYQPETFRCVLDTLRFTCKKLHLLDIHNPNAIPFDYSEIPLLPIVEKVLEDIGPCDIYFPDAGAATRYQDLFAAYNSLTGGKTRDSQTGRLSNFHIKGGTKKSDTVLIVDDICAGGYTFSGQAKVLKELGYSSLYLYTTHGIYSGDTSILSDFRGIYSTNSFSFGKADENGSPQNNSLVVRKQAFVLTTQKSSTIHI